jgi:excisionase family DNA binding protein
MKLIEADIMSSKHEARQSGVARVNRYVVSTCQEAKINPLLLSAGEAAKLIGICRSHFYALHSSGRLGPLPVRLGRRILWNRKELETWVEAGCPSRESWLSKCSIKG